MSEQHTDATAEALDRLAALVADWGEDAELVDAETGAHVPLRDIALAVRLARRAEILIGLLVFTNAGGERICRGCGSRLDAPVAHWVNCPFKAALAATPDAGAGTEEEGG